MIVAAGASAKSQQALGTVVMGSMTAVVILALLMVPILTMKRYSIARPGAGFAPPPLPTIGPPTRGRLAPGKDSAARPPTLNRARTGDGRRQFRRGWKWQFRRA
jgi:hypothetical protein